MLKKSIPGVLFFMLMLFCGSRAIFSQNKLIDSLEPGLSNLKDDTGKVNTLIELSWQYKLGADFNTAIQHANAALALSQQLKYRQGEGDALRRLGRYYQNLNKLNKAREKLNAAIKIREETGSDGFSDQWWEDRSTAALYLDISVTYYIEDNYTEAIKNTLIALALYEKAGHKTGIANAYIRLAGIYGDYLDFESSHKYAKLALKILKELADPGPIAEATCNLGELETEMGNFSAAQEYILSSLKYYESISDSRGIANANRCLGKLYLEQGKLALAENNISTANEKFRLAEKKSLSALEFNNVTGDYVAQAYLYYFLGEIYRGLKQFRKARHYLDLSNNMSVSTKNKYTAKLSYLGLAQLDSTLGNYKAAFDYYKQFILYRDSIVNNVNSAKLEGFKLQYEFDKKEDSLQQQHAITKVKLAAEKEQKYLYWTGLVLLGLLSVLVFTNFRKQKKINRLADEFHVREKAELELHSLRAQLNPHFMFNALNAIQELILMEESEKAQTYLARFAKLLRMLLENADRPFIPLQRELDFLQLYLSLENLRIPDLKHSITVDGAINTEETGIPNMILQPYIENAIWHGLSHKTENRKLEIRIIKPNGYVQYEIEDNGVGRKRSAELKSRFRKEHKSKGMELLSRRFKLLAKEYGSDIQTEYKDVMNGNEIAGTRVTIKVPMEFSTQIKSQVS